MPILDIEVVGHTVDQGNLTQRLADAAGRALNSRPKGTWVKLHWLDAELYAENEGSDQILPVFVSLVQACPPEGRELEKQMVALTDAVAMTLDRPVEHVHILLQPSASGRISFGGTLQT